MRFHSFRLIQLIHERSNNATKKKPTATTTAAMQTPNLRNRSTNHRIRISKSEFGKRCSCVQRVLHCVELVRVSADIIKINNDDEISIIMRSSADSIFIWKHTKKYWKKFECLPLMSTDFFWYGHCTSVIRKMWSNFITV